MSFYCPQCGPEDPKTPPQPCLVEPRRGNGIRRFGYVSCKSLTDVFLLVGQSEVAIYAALNAMLAESPAIIGYTGLLGAVELPDPQSLVENLSDCDPASEIVGARDITFNDYNGYDTNSSGTVSPYWEYDMYNTLNKNASNYAFFHVDCNKDLWLYYKKVGSTYVKLPSSFYGYKTTEKVTLNNQTLFKQVIKGKLSFIGDPMGFDVKPLVNLANATGLLANLL